MLTRLSAARALLSGVLRDRDDGQIERLRARAFKALDRPDRAASLAIGALFAVVATLLGVFLGFSRPFSPATAVVLVIAYTVASRVEFESGPGTVVPTQVVFVPMLGLLPLKDVPVAVAVCYLLGSVIDHVRHGAPLERSVFALTSSWFAIGPVLVLALTHEQRPVSYTHLTLPTICSV